MLTFWIGEKSRKVKKHQSQLQNIFGKVSVYWERDMRRARPVRVRVRVRVISIVKEVFMRYFSLHLQGEYLIDNMEIQGEKQ